MGYAREKYVASYFLKQDDYGQPVWYGAEGVKEFESGGIRSVDKNILDHLIVDGKSVLEIGFGRGEAIKYCAEAGAKEISAVDFSEDSFSIAAAYLRKYNITAELHCEEALSFVKQCRKKGRLFDIVVLLDVVEHIPRGELSCLLEELRFTLSPQAVLAVNTPAYLVDNDVIGEGLDIRAMDSSDQVESTKGMHCNRFTEATLQTFLAEYGFTSLSSHLFAYSLKAPSYSARSAYISAARSGYPVRLDFVNAPDCVERARRLSEEEIRVLKGEYVLKQGRSVMHCFWHAIKRRAKWRLQQVQRMFSGGKAQSQSEASRQEELEIAIIEAGPAQGCKILRDKKSRAVWYKDMTSGMYDAFIYDELKYTKPLFGAVVWDVGAHIGYHTLCFARLVGREGKVVAFEPNKYNRERLLRHVELNPALQRSIVVSGLALSDVDGSAVIKQCRSISNGKSSGSHLVGVDTPENSQSYDGFECEGIVACTGDQIVANGLVPTPDVLKIDVEGAEAMVLFGCRELLLSCRPVLLVEVHHVLAMYECLRYLADCGYSVRVIDRKGSSPSRCFIVALPLIAPTMNTVLPSDVRAP